jgi:cysteine desulfurase
MRVYFDNAATTPLDPDVMKEMYKVMESQFGNPSSIHAHGRVVSIVIPAHYFMLNGIMLLLSIKI